MALSPTAIFQGIDTFQGQLRSAGITGTSNGSNTTTTNTVSICTDTESVSEAISASASVSGSVMDTSADAKATFVENIGMTSTSVVVIVHTITQTTQTANTTQLSDEAATVLGPLTGTQDVQDFYSDYGDSYVSQVVVGGEYYAAFVYDSTTTEQQETVTASLKASNLTFATSLSTSLSDVFEHDRHEPALEPADGRIHRGSSGHRSDLDHPVRHRFPVAGQFAGDSLLRHHGI
jgi:hypothetical protein